MIDCLIVWTCHAVYTTIIKFERNVRKGFPLSCNGFQMRKISVTIIIPIIKGSVFVEDTCVLSGILGTRDSYSKYHVHDGA